MLQRRLTAAILHPVVVVAGCALMLSATPTCGGDVVVDDPPESSGNGGGGGLGPGASSSSGFATVSSSGPATVTGTSTGPGPGPGPSTSVSTGPQECSSCAEFVTGESTLRPCPQSLALYEQLFGCICMVCGAICDFCTGGSDDPTDACIQCVNDSVSVGNPCVEAFDACLNDF